MEVNQGFATTFFKCAHRSNVMDGGSQLISGQELECFYKNISCFPAEYQLGKLFSSKKPETSICDVDILIFSLCVWLALDICK